MNGITLSIDLVNSILQFLGNRPYVESAGLIQGIQSEASKQGIQTAKEPVAEPTVESDNTSVPEAISEIAPAATQAV